jgi:predicted HAD superfamily Cof-like phosphohydrolase
MKSAIESVRDFCVLTEQHVGNVAAPDCTVDRVLRVRLILEELQELLDAAGIALIDVDGQPVRLTRLDPEVVGAVDLAKVADGLADLKYVTEGTAVTWGIPLDAVFAEVHRSNMTKRGGTKDAHGKLGKPLTYEPPDIAGVLERAKRERQAALDACVCHEAPSMRHQDDSMHFSTCPASLSGSSVSTTLARGLEKMNVLLLEQLLDARKRLAAVQADANRALEAYREQRERDAATIDRLRDDLSAEREGHD